MELYADYEPRLLLPFLRSSHHYSLDKVICDSFRILWFLNFSHILSTELFNLLVLLRIGDHVMIVRSLLQVSGFSMTRRNDWGLLKYVYFGCTLQAYDVCTKRGLTRERVFILGRMGNSREALALIVNKLQDMQQVQELQLSETFNGCPASKSPLVVCLKDIFKGTGCPNHCPLCRTCYAFGIDACLLRVG